MADEPRSKVDGSEMVRRWLEDETSMTAPGTFAGLARNRAFS